ncbi:MAG TPA: glycosyltransferase [Thermoleophilaceae bacterium]|nr:glycosyltransferase [Thermoleophilaceae bacterium]
MRVCLVYDCLYPHTVGGAERWYRNVGERLAREGHAVTYLTLRQWARDETPDAPAGVAVATAGPRMPLYRGPRRRIEPPLVFGAGVLWHLLRRGRRYDVVHLASFPYFSLLAAALARPLGGYRVVVDWHEVWTLGYWRGYLGRLPGRVGWLVQRLCALVPQRAFCFSRLHAERLRSLGFRGEVEVLHGQYVPRGERPSEESADPPAVVFAGRHIPEKRAHAVVPAVAAARERIPSLRAEILGDGPEHGDVLEAVERAGLAGVVATPGFVSGERVDAALQDALCMLLPSMREGYGLVVLEAAARGTPSVVVSEPDNAATELVEDGVNGFVVPSASPGDLADAIVRAHEAGPALRRSTAAWFGANRERLSLEGSLGRVVEAYTRL